MTLIVKYALTALVVVIVSEIAKRSGKLGAFIGTLPIVAIMVMTWLYIDTRDVGKLAEYASYTFWYVLAGLPAFLAFEFMLRREQPLPVAMVAALAAALLGFAACIFLARRFGVELLP